MGEEFVGRGWGYPIHVDTAGGIALVERHQEVEEAMRLVLGTAYGERPMRPEFGCGIHDYVFAPADPTTAGLLAYEVRTSLTRWEPRVDILDVTVTIDEIDRGTLLIDIVYSIRGSNDPKNLVFPFYVIPPEEA